MNNRINPNSKESHLYSNINHIGREVRIILCNSGWTINDEIRYTFGVTNMRPSEFKIWTYKNGLDGDTINDLIRYKLLAVHFSPKTTQELEEFKEFHKNVLSGRVSYGRTTILLIDGYSLEGCQPTLEYLDSIGLETPCPELTVNFPHGYDQDIQLTDILGEPLWNSVYLDKRKEPKDVCFLDVDGVLLPTKGFVSTNWSGTFVGEYMRNPILSISKFDQDALSFLKKLASETGLSFVLSSQWRIGMSDEDVLTFGRYLGLPIIGKVVNGGNRPFEIAKWLEDNPITGKAFSIDDESFQVEGVKEFHIKAFDGIKFSDMTDICNYLGTDIYNFTNSRFIQHKSDQEEKH